MYVCMYVCPIVTCDRQNFTIIRVYICLKNAFIVIDITTSITTPIRKEAIPCMVLMYVHMPQIGQQFLKGKTLNIQWNLA